MYSPTDTAHDNFISNLESTFSKSCHIQVAEKSECTSEGDGYFDVVEGKICGGRLIQQETRLDNKCLRNCTDVAYPDVMLPPCSLDEEGDISSTEWLSEQSALQPSSSSGSLPVSSPRWSCLDMLRVTSHVYLKDGHSHRCMLFLSCANTEELLINSYTIELLLVLLSH